MKVDTEGPLLWFGTDFLSTHGVTTKATKYVEDGKESTDSIDVPYEDEVDE